jgi:hypothetical protein
MDSKEIVIQCSVCQYPIDVLDAIQCEMCKEYACKIHCVYMPMLTVCKHCDDYAEVSVHGGD